jgi:polyisoprenoid-binding protein YceI
METTTWILDPTHSELGFKIRHLMITNISGSFTNFQVKAETRGNDFTTASITVTADMSTISTNNTQRDAHLRNSDFFEVDQHPEMKFKSTKVEEIDSNTFVLHGNLTLKGITKPVQLNVEYSPVTRDPWGGERAGFTINGKIRRTDWGINFNSVLETGGVALAEDVRINAEIQMVKQPVAVPA